jgi:hypothetical protein
VDVHRGRSSAARGVLLCRGMKLPLYILSASVVVTLSYGVLINLIP